MSTKVEQIQKINKLLQLSKSQNENEAKLALENATKLMNLFQITSSDLERGMVIEGNKIILTRPLQKYEKFIVSFCISTNHCRAIIFGNKREIQFIGRELNISVAQLMFDYIKSFIKRQGKSLLFKRTIHWNSYTLGFIQALKFKQVQEMKTWSEADKNALVLIQNEDELEVEGYINNMGIKEERSKAIRVNDRLQQMGVQDGLNFNLDRQMTSGNEVLRIGER